MPQLRPLAIGLLAALLAAGGAHAAKAPAPKPAAAKKAQPKAAAKPTQPKPAPAAATAAPPPVDPNLISLETVSGMSEAGAPRLALGIMDRDQPDPAKDPAGWMSWERERIYIYQSSHAWKAVVRRMGKLPKDATPDFRAWEAMQAADAWLHMGDGAKALALVQPLIWDEKHPPDERDLAALRQLVIRCYTSLGRLDDAQAAVIRYRQDYPKDAGAWPLLEARLFLRSGQPQSALDVLQDVAGDEADMLALLASLRSGTLTPGDALGQAVKIGSDSKAPAAEQVRAWIIAAEAADRLHNPAARISALQNALGLQDVLIEQDDVFVLSPDMLWDAYISYGEALGNDLQLVVGDDQAWFVAASNQYDTAPIGAAALFSVVAYQAGDPKQSSVAHGQFAALLQRQRYGGVVLRHLYLDSERFKDPESVPAEVRYLLVDDVLAMPDIPLASRLLQGLDSAPPAAPGEKRDEAAAEMAWQLKRAHVFILGGDPAAGVASLHKLIEGEAPVDVEEVLQVLFDLQTLHRDKDAIPLFEALLAKPLPPDQRRQMLYWTADSYKAVEDFPKAAELYLRSAMLPGPFTLDPWAQTARYQAAQMLGRAGYIEDARQLYRGLLNATRDPAQQAVLEHDLQQLMLLPAKSGGELH
ncbi:MAG TPA: hypothetical protein VF651_09085 [Gammaproteobacteria bacterium]